MTFLIIRMIISGLLINDGDAQGMLSKILESLENIRNEVKEQRLEIRALIRTNETVLQASAIRSVRRDSTHSSMFWTNACERAPMTFESELEVQWRYQTRMYSARNLHPSQL